MACRFFLLVLVLLVFACAGCSVDKAPPTVTWIAPSSPLSVTEGAAVTLQFAIADPAPTRGQTGAGTWRVQVGPESGAIWWTTSGDLSLPPDGGMARDTVSVNWLAPPLPSGTPGPIALTVSALATDGEGQTGAAFKSAQLNGNPLNSSGLWWCPGPPSGGFNHLSALNPGTATWHPGPGQLTHLIHMDGDAMLVGGQSNLMGWSIADGGTSVAPSWTAAMPPTAMVGGIRYVRRAPTLATGPAQAEVGWTDRCTWHGADGTVSRTWLLLADETLVDGRTLDDHMVLLARTSAGALRLCRYNLDSGARLSSVEWNPTAAGSLGMDGKVWLLSTAGLPVALETDGQGRKWNPQDGATPLSTVAFPGTGAVSAAGAMEDGRMWLNRDAPVFLNTDGAVAGDWGSPIIGTAMDRAEGRLWILSAGASEAQWQAADPNNFTPLGPPVSTGSQASSGSIAHNRPGPP